jgi:hypothetical protein
MAEEAWGGQRQLWRHSATPRGLIVSWPILRARRVLLMMRNARSANMERKEEPAVVGVRKCYTDGTVLFKRLRIASQKPLRREVA